MIQQQTTTILLMLCYLSCSSLEPDVVGNEGDVGRLEARVAALLEHGVTPFGHHGTRVRKRRRDGSAGKSGVHVQIGQQLAKKLNSGRIAYVYK
jgi:hypothetical protein